VLSVVADTNIYVSVFAFGGPITKIFELAQEGHLELAISPPILREIEQVFSRKFHWPEQRIAALTDNILGFAHLVNPGEHLSAIAEDPADNRILECSLEANASLIVSGDRHLLNLGTFRGVQIVSPRQFLDWEGWSDS
jgi:putative PIN family toxin of toxin-antitoxin system